MYSIEFNEGWDEYFDKLAPEIQKRVWKKIIKIKEGLPSRHLGHGLGYFVEELGQYRICYKSSED